MKLPTIAPTRPKPVVTVSSDVPTSGSSANQSPLNVTATAVATTTVDVVEHGSQASSAALRGAIIGQQGVGSQTKAKAPGATLALLGLQLLQGAKQVVSSLNMGVKAAMVGMLLVGTPLLASADTVFLDHNNAPKEIAVARDLARSKGEPFILVRPDKSSLDSVFAKAERGEANIRHLILSGHSSGLQVWGVDNAGTPRESSIDQFKELKAKYPKAFNQVQHVTFMSCYAGSAGNSAQWSAVFDKARGISGFFGSGPSKDQPAAHKMLKNTELAMRALPAGRLSPQQALITAKQMAQQPGANVTLFAVRLDGTHHARGQSTTPLDQASDRSTMLRLQAFEPFFEGRAGFESVPTNHARSPLRDYYNALQAHSNALPADDWQRGEVNTAIGQTIRLIYFDAVVAKFQGAHQGTIDAARAEAANAKLGIAIPTDLTKLNRAQILELSKAIDGVDVSSHLNLQTLRDLLRDGLRNLDTTIIPSTWIG